MEQIKCKNCGKMFSVSPSRVGKRFSCSKECFDSMPKTWLIGSDRNKGQVPWNKGVPCREETKEKLSVVKKGKPSTFTGKHHTIEARAKMSETRLGRKHTKETCKLMSSKRKGNDNPAYGKTYRSGENHYSWKGGITPENKIIRHSMGITHWRMAVFTRDNFTCQDCGARGTELNAHHIEHFAKNKDLRTEVNNGVTLCKECHKKKHSIAIF